MPTKNNGNSSGTTVKVPNEVIAHARKIGAERAIDTSKMPAHVVRDVFCYGLHRRSNDYVNAGGADATEAERMERFQTICDYLQTGRTLPAGGASMTPTFKVARDKAAALLGITVKVGKELPDRESIVEKIDAARGEGAGEKLFKWAESTALALSADPLA